MKVCFDITHLYYLPQYLPVITELGARGDTVHLVCYQDMQEDERTVLAETIEELNFSATWITSSASALSYYQNSGFDWIVFGNGFNGAEVLSKTHRTVLMQHGIGPKKCYYDVSDSGMNVRFVEGKHRLNKLQSLYPHAKFVDVGYAKLDPLLSGFNETLDLSSLGLDTAKKTILYAPTFYPSSIEKMPDNLPEILIDFNIIIKPHQFSMTKNKYKKQREKLRVFESYDNVYLAKSKEYNLLPFMSVADVMLSDASSAVFEFLALGKPVVWCNFYKLRWSYRGPLKFRFKGRLDDDINYFRELCSEVLNPEYLMRSIRQVFDEPSLIKDKRLKEIEVLAGQLDGQASIRIVNYLKEV